MRRFHVLMVVLLLYEVANADNTVLVADVLNNPSKFADTEVTISGFIKIEFESYWIAPSKEHEFGKCIWMTFDEEKSRFTEKDIENWKNRAIYLEDKYNNTVTGITGYLTIGKFGHMAPTCSGRLDIFEHEFGVDAKQATVHED